MRTPMALVRASLAMLPRLQAEEALLVVQATALGTGSLKPGEARQVRDRLVRAAGHRRAPAQRMTPEGLAAIGIGFREVPR
jgi:hypothetical protein